MKLTRCITRYIVPTSPFDFNSTFHKPAHFPSGDNYWESGKRLQTFRFMGENLGIVFTSEGAREKPKIKVDIYSKKQLLDSFIQSFIGEVEYRYNLDLDLSEFYELYRNDETLGPVIKRMYGMRPGHQDSLYEYLIIGIVLQNCTVKRSVQMMQNLFDHYGTLLEYDDKKLWCFWKPGYFENVTEEELRFLKLGYRAKFIKKIDEQFRKGLIDEKALRDCNLETQTKELLKLYGVGPATVWYLLFDVFHWYDFFDHVSPWEQKIYSKLFFDKDPDDPVPVEKLIEHFHRYGKYRQLAVHYIWEDLWWKRKSESIPWLDKLIRL